MSHLHPNVNIYVYYVYFDPSSFILEEEKGLIVGIPTKPKARNKTPFVQDYYKIILQDYITNILQDYITIILQDYQQDYTWYLI